MVELGFLVDLLVLHQVDDWVGIVVHHAVVGLVDIHHGVVVDGFEVVDHHVEVVDFVVVHSVWWWLCSEEPDPV